MVLVVLRKKRISILCCCHGVYTKTLGVVSCMSCHKVCCPEVSGVSWFYNLFDVNGVRNSFRGIAGISPLTILKEKVSCCCALLSWSDCS